MHRLPSHHVALVVALASIPLGCSTKQLESDDEAAEVDEFSSEEGEPCFDFSERFEFPGEVCMVTPSNLVVYIDAIDRLAIARIAASGSALELSEIVKYESHQGCGQLAHDEVGDRLWLLEGGSPGPLRLRALDGEGTLAWEQELPAWVMPSLVTHERDVLISGALENPDDSYTAQALRLDVDGNQVWSQSGFVAASDDPERPMSNLASPVHVGNRVVYLGSQWGIDSAAVSLVALDPADGSVGWHTLLTPDDFSGPRYDLGGDGERAYLTVVREPSQVDPGDPATVELVAYSEAGTIEWMHEETWPEGYQIDATSVVRGADELYLSGLGLRNDGQADGRQIAYSLDGTPRCIRGLTMTSIHGHTVLPDGRYALFGEDSPANGQVPVILVHEP